MAESRGDKMSSYRAVDLRYLLIRIKPKIQKMYVDLCRFPALTFSFEGFLGGCSLTLIETQYAHATSRLVILILTLYVSILVLLG